MKHLDSNHILIGLGGTGGKVLKAFRKRLWEEYPDAKERENLPLGFLYVDTDKEMMNSDDPSWRVLGQNAVFTKDEFVYIKSLDTSQILDNLDNYPGLKRIVNNPEMMRKTLGEVGKAAGQKRRAGRLLFAANVDQYMAAVGHQYTKVTQQKSGHSNGLNIHIFAGLAGGTGSGSIVDAITQLRVDPRFSGEDTHINVYAMVPELSIPEGCQAGRYHQNGYAALCELSALNAGAWIPCDVRTGEEHARINTISKKRFSLMVYSNVNENGSVVNSFTELPTLLSDTVYFTIFTPSNGTSTENYRRGFTNENKNDYLVEYNFLSKNNDRQPARTKAVNSFGIKRIVYPEQRVVEHISYTLANNAFMQMAFNNYKENLGYVNEPQRKDYDQLYIKNDGTMRRWKLTDSFFVLNERILESDPKFDTIEKYWEEQATFYSYDDAKNADANPLSFVAKFCDEQFKHNFRGNKEGVVGYYQDKCNVNVLEQQAAAIIDAIEDDLYDQWYKGTLSLADLLNITDAILTYIKGRRKQVDNDIATCDEKTATFQKELTDNINYYDHLGTFQKLTGKKQTTYTDHQYIAADLYVQRTYREAYEFAKRLLSKLQTLFEEFRDSVQAFVGGINNCMKEASVRIADRNQKQGSIDDMKPAVIEVREDEKVVAFEKELIINPNEMEGIASALRRTLAGDNQHTRLSDLIDSLKPNEVFEKVDRELGARVQNIQSNKSKKEKLTGINVLEQLQHVLTTPDEISRFAEEAIQKSGVFITLDDGEVKKSFPNNEDTFILPAKNILITMPPAEGDDSLKAFAEQLKTAFEHQFEKKSDNDSIEFNISDDRMNEITICVVKSIIPLRALKWLPEYEREYKILTENPNPTMAKEAKVILHSEGDGTQLPPIMGEKMLSAKEFGPYFFLAVATGAITEGDDEINGHGWNMTTYDEWESPVKQFLSPLFTDIASCDAMTSEARSALQDAIEEKLANPELTMAARAQMAEEVKRLMRDVVAKECTSTSSPKYQQFSSEARKAMEMINKK